MAVLAQVMDLETLWSFLGADLPGVAFQHRIRARVILTSVTFLRTHRMTLHHLRAQWQVDWLHDAATTPTPWSP